LILLVFLWIKHGVKGLWFALGAILVVAITDPISSLWLKKWIARPRPCETAELAPFFPNLTHCSAGFSMPSSHAANHYALATFLGLSQKPYYPRWNLLLGLWAALICFAQLYVGVHYLGDVLVGAILGISLGAMAFVSFKIIFKNTFHEL
jgi:undecaprenyl-diphosphatase